MFNVFENKSPMTAIAQQGKFGVTIELQQDTTKVSNAANKPGIEGGKIHGPQGQSGFNKQIN